MKNRLIPVISENNLLTDVQFGWFRGKHLTMEQIHRVVNSITSALEDREFAPAVFLDVSSALDKVWHRGLIHKLLNFFSESLCKLLSSYLANRSFFVMVGEAISYDAGIEAEVPHGSLLYTSDFPVLDGVTASLFADNSAVVVCDKIYKVAVEKLQLVINHIVDWARVWKIGLNVIKSVRVDFALRKHGYTPTYIYGKPIPLANSARYLGLHLDSKLNWEDHVKKKREYLNSHP